MNLLLSLLGLLLADCWLYVALSIFWRFVRIHISQDDWQPAVWELRDTPGKALPLGRPLDPSTRRPLRDTWEPIRLPNPFVIVRDGKVYARYVISGPRWTAATMLIWYVPEIVCFGVAPAILLLIVVS